VQVVVGELVVAEEERVVLELPKILLFLLEHL
jgi:hypothetical protein